MYDFFWGFRTIPLSFTQKCLSFLGASQAIFDIGENLPSQAVSGNNAAPNIKV
jgi:hypothetical protein